MKFNVRKAIVALTFPILVAACSSSGGSDTTSVPVVAETAGVAEVDSAVTPTDEQAVALDSSTADITTVAPATGRTPVTVVLDWTPNTNHTGIYLAKAKGFYETAGLDVTIIEPGQEGGLAQLDAGNAEFAVSSAEYLLPARVAGAKVISVASILQHNTSSLIVPKDRGILRPKDLEGRTYGGFGGPLEKALVDKLVTCDGGDPSTIKYVEIGNVDYKVGLERKDYDFVWVFDAWDGIRLGSLEKMDLVSFPFYATEGTAAGCIPDWYTPLIASTDQLTADKPDLVRAFVSATAKGYELARTSPAEASDVLLSAAPELDKALVRESAAYLATRYADAGTPWGRQDTKVWTDFIKLLVDTKVMEGDVTADQAFTNEFLPK